MNDFTRLEIVLLATIMTVVPALSFALWWVINKGSLSTIIHWDLFVWLKLFKK